MSARRPYIAVAGSGDPEASLLALAEDVGRHLAVRGAIVIGGGLSGVMEAACRGAKAAGGTTVGILPGHDRRQANAFVDVAVPTGMGEARNALVARAADVLVAVGGEYGTLSEIALALRLGKPVVGVSTWELHRDGSPVDAIVRVDDAEAAAAEAIALAAASTGAEGGM